MRSAGMASPFGSCRDAKYACSQMAFLAWRNLALCHMRVKATHQNRMPDKTETPLMTCFSARQTL